MDCTGDHERRGWRQQGSRHIFVGDGCDRGMSPQHIPIGGITNKYKVFSGGVPFADSTPMSVAATVLLGDRPGRPKDPILTNRLWVLTQRCLAQDPRQRPEIMEVVCDLREASVIRQDCTNAADVARVDDTTSGSTKQREPPRRTPSFITPFEVTLTGLKGSRYWILLRRFWRRLMPKKSSPESKPASGRTHSFRSSSRDLLGRASCQLLTCGSPPVQDHYDHSDSSLEKQGKAYVREGVSRSNHCRLCSHFPVTRRCASYPQVDSFTPLKRSLMQRTEV